MKKVPVFYFAFSPMLLDIYVEALCILVNFCRIRWWLVEYRLKKIVISEVPGYA